MPRWRLIATQASAQTRGVTKTEIVLGMHTDLSGVAATYGVSSSNGVKMRFDEINEAGGINGRKIKVIIEDQGYQVPKAVQACNKLINRDKVFAFVAPLGTPMNNACFKDQFAAGVPNLFPLSAARSMYEPYERLKFYGAASYVDQIRSAVNYFVKKKGKKTICVMYQDTDFGKEILEGAELQTKKLGIKIVETAAHKPTDQDFTASLTKLKGAGCDLVADGHHRARLDRALRHGAQDGLDRRRLPRLRGRLRPGRRRSAGHGRLLRHGPHRDALRRQRGPDRSRRSSRPTRRSSTSIPTSARSMATSPPTSRPPA